MFMLNKISESESESIISIYINDLKMHLLSFPQYQSCSKLR